MKKNYSEYIGFFILLVLIYFPLFGFQDSLPIRMWDEARMAMNAYEMSLDHNFIVTHYLGKPEMWSTKPPLMIWCQQIFIKLIGINELSLRLPSSIAGFFICLLLLFFSLKYFKDIWFGAIAAIVLVTSQGYIGEHAVRSGDYDALMAFFSSSYCIFFFLYLEFKKTKYLYLTFIAASLAVLTKSIAPLMFLPALLIYSLITKQTLDLLKNKHFYIGIAIFILVVGSYFLLREYMNPGYLKAVNENDISGRYMQSVEFHKHEFLFYFNNLMNERFISWLYLLPCGLIIGLIHKDKKYFRITLYSSLLILSFFLVISSAQTKLLWYDVPLYPFLSIIVAVFIYYFFSILKNNESLHLNLKYKIIPFIFLFLLFLEPYELILKKTYKPVEIDWDKEFYSISYFMRDALHGKYDINNYYICKDGFPDQYQLYIYLLREKGKKIDYKDCQKLETGDKVIAYQTKFKDYIEKNYSYDVIKDINNIRLYKILSRK